MCSVVALWLNVVTNCVNWSGLPSSSSASFFLLSASSNDCCGKEKVWHFYTTSKYKTKHLHLFSSAPFLLTSRAAVSNRLYASFSVHQHYHCHQHSPLLVNNRTKAFLNILHFSDASAIHPISTFQYFFICHFITKAKKFQTG